MKNYFFVYIFLAFGLVANSQELEKKISEQFEIRFSSAEDKQDLVRLRDFLESKDADYNKLRSALEDESIKNVFSNDSLTFVEYKKQLETFLEKHNSESGYFERKEINSKIYSICLIASAIETYDDNGIKKERYNVRFALDNVDSWIRTINRKSIILSSANNVNKDRDAAAKAIQRIYNVEKGNQDYKTTISLYYAVIIFFLIVISFYFLFKKSTPEIGNDFLNGNGLQFIALFAIIISTILFGILGILEGKELAAILSGIAGFILGKGLNVSLTKKE